MARLITALFFLLAIQTSFGQSGNVIGQHDSLMRILPTLTTDSDRADALREIGKTWISRDPAKALVYGKQSLALARKIKDMKRETAAMITLGYQYSVFGRTVESIEILQEAIHNAQEMKDPQAELVAVAFISTAYSRQGDVENALKYARQSYRYFAANYPRLPHFREQYIGASMNMGEVLMNFGKLDSALLYASQAHKVMIETNGQHRYFAFHIPELLGEIHLRLRQNEKALPFIQEGLLKATGLNDETGIIEGRLNLARYYTQINQPDSAVANALKVVESAGKIKKFEAVQEASLLLREWFETQKDLDKALFYNDLASAAKDSLSNTEEVKGGQQLIFKEQQYQQKLADAKAEYQNRLLLYLLITGLAIFLLIAVILYLNNRRKQKDNMLLLNEIRLQEVEFAGKLADTEMTALRAQMNPHFIFNCLNSIKLYTLENDSEAASDYLTKFSRLIRLVLKNSRSEKVTLENELETLELYMEMEAMRFKNKVRYEIDIAENIDVQYIEIPPLLLQPFVENAIWHGLMQKEEGGMVLVEVAMISENTLLVSITDDGIGRAAASKLKSKSAARNKSFRLKMTSERIDLINKLYKSETQVRILDLQDTENQPAGTRVEVEIPV